MYDNDEQPEIIDETLVCDERLLFDDEDEDDLGMVILYILVVDEVDDEQWVTVIGMMYKVDVVDVNDNEMVDENDVNVFDEVDDEHDELDVIIIHDDADEYENVLVYHENVFGMLEEVQVIDALE